MCGPPIATSSTLSNVGCSPACGWPRTRRRSRRPDAEEFLADVVAGLTASPKTLPSKYFYDEQGSALFEAICDLPEYYLTRTETKLLTEAAADIARHISDGAALIEFGSGASVKTRLLLEAAPQTAAYIPIDISADALAPAAAAIRARFPAIEVAPLVGDFTQALDLPAAANGRPRTGFFPARPSATSRQSRRWRS